MKIPPVIGFYDIETYHGFSSDIALIGYKEIDKPFEYYTDPVKFIERLNLYHKLRLFGYNSGRYDTPVLLEALKRRDYPISINNVIFSGSAINTLQLNKIVFKDIILSLGGRWKLNQISKDFFGEGKIDYDSSNITEVTPDLIKYNEQDVVLTERLYKKIEEILQTRISTAPSMSFAIYKDRFNPMIEMKCPKRGIRDTYKGGRNEIFKFTGKDINVYDVNSLYPYVMSKYSYPVGSLHKENNIDKDGYSFAIVDIPYSYIPYLGLKAYNKLLFPYGSISGYFTNFELREAKRLGATIKVIEGWVADESEFLFEKYVKHYYDARLEAKRNNETAKDVMYKMLLNSLYGKFGQREEKDNIKSVLYQEYLGQMNTPQYINAELLLTYQSNKGEMAVLKMEKKKRFVYHDYLVSSYITAYARHTLYDYFLKAGLDNVSYCDTDSIFTISDLSNVCGKDLGLVKLEKTFKEYKAIAPKIYRGITEDGKRYKKAKGIRGEKRKDDSGKEYYHIPDELYDDTSRYMLPKKDKEVGDFKKSHSPIESYISPSGMKESLRRFKSFFSVIKREKYLRSEYTKRIRDGENTKPLKMIDNIII